jgi:SAM-dependent methyltransferase
MGFYADQVLPRAIDRALGRSVEPVRARVAAGLSGEVLEVGFGSGRNVPHLPAGVTRLVAVDPAVVGRRLAAGRLAASAVPVEFIGLDGQSLPLPDESIDHVLVTWTLCTIPDVHRALSEMHRVLRPGGALHFVEHGRSPHPKSAKRQRRLGPVWGRLAGGCHLDRPIPDLVAAAGFDTADVRSYRDRGPELVSRMYEGVAHKV